MLFNMLYYVATPTLKMHLPRHIGESVDLFYTSYSLFFLLFWFSQNIVKVHGASLFTHLSSGSESYLSDSGIAFCCSWFVWLWLQAAILPFFELSTGSGFSHRVFERAPVVVIFLVAFTTFGIALIAALSPNIAFSVVSLNLFLVLLYQLIGT